MDCGCGSRHWGRHGAAGLLLVAGTGEVLLQHRAAWSHHGGTWGLPGGARTSAETPVEAALREAVEETALDPGAVRPVGVRREPHPGWCYYTVRATCARPLPVARDHESADLRWVPAGDVPRYPLHPGLAAAWPVLTGPRAALLVDAANVVGAVPDGWWRDREAAARRLLDRLEALAGLALPGPSGGAVPGATGAAAGGPLVDRVVAVLEGAARPAGAGRPPVALVDAVAAPGSGDDALAGLAAALVADDPGRPVVAVTADRGLAARLAAAGARVVGPSWLLDRLPGAPAGPGAAAAGPGGSGRGRRFTPGGRRARPSRRR